MGGGSGPHWGGRGGGGAPQNLMGGCLSQNMGEHEGSLKNHLKIPVKEFI